MIDRLIREGAVVSAFDPIAMEIAGRILLEVTLANDPYSLAKGCDAIIVLTPGLNLRT